MILVAAASSDGILDHGRGSPWQVPEEYAGFLEQVRGQTVILGRRSFETYGSDLTSRFAIVLSRTARSIPGAQVARSLDQAVRIGEMLGHAVYTVGSASVYPCALPLADRLLLSTVREPRVSGASFPRLDTARWRVRREADRRRFVVRVYERAG